MADLDDFFAKKDKKKKGKKFVTANTDVLATKLEASARKEQEAEMKIASAAMTTGQAGVEAGLSRDPNTEGKDEEWKDYEEFKKDYTGLKIESIKIDSDNQANGDDDDGELNEDGEKIRGKKNDGGPWNKISGTAGTGSKLEEPEDSPSSTPEPNIPDVPPAGQKSAYVPPHLRGSGGSSTPSQVTSQAAKGSSRRNKAAPDISNEFNFPSLAAAVADTPGKTVERDRDVAFERVRSGGGQQHSKTSEGPKLTLDNKFAALRGDH